MRRWCPPIFPVIAFWFGVGILLALLCSLELALFIAVVLMLILALSVMRIL